jgi:oligopeptide/dipeptide ABC transporter ATP-binding protein
MRETPVTQEAVLEVKGMRTVFHTRGAKVEAVRDVSFRLAPGERIGIVGESGSGKSALALSLLGLVEPPGQVLRGEVWLGGREIRRLSDRALGAIRGKEIALVPQDPMTALDPVKTIGSQIYEAITLHQTGVRRDAVRAMATELLREVEIPQPEARLRDYPHQYSGGMRQRVVIAMALANRPSVLIADEPTTALDVTTQAQVLDLLDKRVEEYGAAVIMITHNLGIVGDFCDTLAVMYAGRLVEVGPAERVLATTAHPYTEALLSCVPDPERLARGPLPVIPGVTPDLSSLPAGCSFEPRCSLGQGRPICREQSPPIVVLSDAGGQSTVECHFAQDRLARTGE